MALIRRTRSNLTVTPGTGLGSVTPNPVLNRATIPLGQLAGKDILSGATFEIFKGGGGATTNIPDAVLRQDTSVFVPTAAQKRVVTPQQVIGGNIVQIEKVAVTNAQKGIISVEYSTPTPKLSAISSPTVKIVSNADQASAVSNLLGRTVQTGQALTKADVDKINTPRSYGGFIGGMGWGQAFPVNEGLFKLAQAAVDKQRAFALATKARFSVSLPGGGKQPGTVSFTKVQAPAQTTMSTVQILRPFLK
jgi:hypothetical protein